LEIVRALLDAKAEVNKATSEAGFSGQTPLYEASMKGHLEVVRALLDAKAEVNKASNTGITPLYMALSGDHTQIAALLREAGAHEPQPQPQNH
jgi:ankyrin repeat protein